MTGLQDTLPQPNPRFQRLSRNHPRRHQRVSHDHHDSEESDTPLPTQQHSPAARSGGVKLNPGDQHNTRRDTTRVSPSIHAPPITSSRRRRKHGQVKAEDPTTTDASTRFNTTSEEEEDEEDSTNSDTSSDSAGSLLLNITTTPHATITPDIVMQRWAAAGNAHDGTGNKGPGTGSGTGNAGNAAPSRHSRQSSAWSRSSEIEKGFRRGRQGNTTAARPAVPQGNPRGRKGSGTGKRNGNAGWEDRLQLVKSREAALEEARSEALKEEEARRVRVASEWGVDEGEGSQGCHDEGDDKGGQDDGSEAGKRDEGQKEASEAEPESSAQVLEANGNGNGNDNGSIITNDDQPANGGVNAAATPAEAEDADFASEDSKDGSGPKPSSTDDDDEGKEDKNEQHHELEPEPEPEQRLRLTSKNLQRNDDDDNVPFRRAPTSTTNNRVNSWVNSVVNQPSFPDLTDPTTNTKPPFNPEAKEWRPPARSRSSRTRSKKKKSVSVCLPPGDEDANSPSDAPSLAVADGRSVSGGDGNGASAADRLPANQSARNNGSITAHPSPKPNAAPLTTPVPLPPPAPVSSAAPKKTKAQLKAVQSQRLQSAIAKARSTGTGKVDMKAILQQLQEEEQLKLGEREILREDGNARATDGGAALLKARMGPGCVKGGEVEAGIARVREERAVGSGGEPRLGLGEVRRVYEARGGQVVGADQQVPGGEVFDWQGRRWEKKDSDAAALRFRGWLKVTCALEEEEICPWDARFHDGEYHLVSKNWMVGGDVNVRREWEQSGSRADAGFYKARWWEIEGSSVAQMPPGDPGNEHVHETVLGYMHNWQLAELEEARREEEREALERENERARAEEVAAIPVFGLSAPPVQPAGSIDGKNANVDAGSDEDDGDDDDDSSRRAPPEPKLVRGIYIRPMEVKDVPFVLAIQNFYIAHGYSPETAPKTGKQLRAELDRARRLKYPYLVAAETGPGRGHANNPEQEHILGYAAMSDFCGLPHGRGCSSSSSRDSAASNSIYRYNAQLDFAVAPASRHEGVGTCLLERSLMVVDDEFLPMHTCHFDCAPGDRGVYVAAQARPLLKVVVVVNYPSKGIEEYRSWARRWITRRYGFEEETCHRGLGVKNGVKLDTVCLVRRVMPFAGARRKYGLKGLV